MSDANTGDRVVIELDSGKIEGVIMPRPDILEGEIIVLKLDHGYNMGIEKSKIKDIQVLSKYESKNVELPKLKFNAKLPTVAFLSCGGTISSKIDYNTGGVVADYSAEDFVAMIPELSSVANIKTRKVMNVMSEDMGPEEWAKLSEAIVEELNDTKVSGVVVTQGTDTLHYSAAAISFYLENLNKPVVFTAAQKSIDRGSSDAFMNLKCAVNAAAKLEAAEVVTCMHGSTNDDYCSLIRGTKVRKMHSSSRDAFKPMNAKPIGRVNEDGTVILEDKDVFEKSDSTVSFKNKFENKTGLLHVYPGMNEDVLDAFKGYKGLVLVGTGLGHLISRLFDKIEELRENGTTIVVTTQTLYGATNPLVYSHLRELSIKLKCIFVHDCLPEVAYIKLGWLLGQGLEGEELKSCMQENLAGEINTRTLY